MNQIVSEVEALATGQNVSSRTIGTAGRKGNPAGCRPSCSPGVLDLPQVPGAAERPITKILVPTNYSDASAYAVRRAVAIANQCHAALTILHVVDVSAQRAQGMAEDFMKGLWHDGSAQMASLACSLAGEVNAQTVIAEGLPWEVIAEKSSHFDLVVMADSKRKKRWNPFCKHTTRRVIENTACPVVVVRL